MSILSRANPGPIPGRSCYHNCRRKSRWLWSKGLQYELRAERASYVADDTCVVLTIDDVTATENQLNGRRRTAYTSYSPFTKTPCSHVRACAREISAGSSPNLIYDTTRYFTCTQKLAGLV